MKTIRIYIKGDFQEGYIYGGQLFIIGNDGNLSAIPLWDVISENLIYSSDEYNFFRLIFSQNNWLNNEQGESFLKINTFKENFDRLWKKYSKIEYHFALKKTQLNKLHSLKTYPTLDMLIYGMRLFVGNTTGLYETGFSISNDNKVTLNEPVERVFDSRVTNISAKSGSLMISSNSDGLFHGQLLEINQRLKVRKTPISKNSLRSGWSGYDVVNYESQKNFNYLRSDISRTKERTYLYKDESDIQKINIDNVGSEVYTFEDLLINSRISKNDIIYSFNSSQICFFFLSDGRLEGMNFRKESKELPVRLSSRHFELPDGLTNKKQGIKPISTKMVPHGVVIEYFDQVILIHNDVKTILETNPVISIKTFPGSIRYKNLISIFDGQGVAIHSLYPF